MVLSSEKIFRFPKDEPKRSLWIDNMKIKNFTPTKNHRICSKHFENNYFYETTTGKSNLLNQAEPTIFNELPKSVRPKRELRKLTMVHRWKDHETEIFLDLYKKHECLWNNKSENYKNRVSREKAINTILSELNIADLSEYDIKSKIKSIRTKYMAELHKILNSAKSTDDIYWPKLYWFTQADSFLRPVSIPKKSSSNSFQTIPKMAEGQVDEIYEDDDPLVGTDEEEIFEIDVKPDTSASTPSEFRLSTPVLKLSTPSTSNKRGTKRNNTSEVSSIDTAIKKLQKISETKKNSPSHLKTEFDFFCHSLAIQLNNMPLKRALICQSKLQSVMLKERLSQMGDNNSADHEKQHSVSNSPSHSSNSEEEDSTHEEPSHPKT
uniref:Uncharacterized protein LOC114343110 isoform X2 n=1 Tax=Diabrotica virgifera virgifera TaxID=50390 RepID=A0A6P7GUP9_DIAVI